jgi:hypothetical protein
MNLRRHPDAPGGYETDQPLSLEALRGSVSKLPASVYRSKGVVHTTEEPGRRVSLQGVGKRVDIAVGPEWNGREAQTRIVVIGADDGIDEAAQRGVFDAFCAGVNSPMRAPLAHTSETYRRGDAPAGTSEHSRRHIRVQATTRAIGLQER